MRRTKSGISPRVDVLEARALLATAAPLLSQHALSGVVRHVRAIMSTLAETGDTAQASAQLTSLSARIPSGPQGLAPSWRSDLGLYRPHTPGSVHTTQRRILGDLDRFVQGGVSAGNRPGSGSGSTTPTPPGQGPGGAATPPGEGPGGTTTPVPASGLDSVRIQNTTGVALVVTVHLKVTPSQQPLITETIPAQGSSIVSFDFGTATDAFMTMDVSRADGGQTPLPFTDISLTQPMGGYNGALFTISSFGPYFNVTPL
jgi:hypothetical protein